MRTYGPTRALTTLLAAACAGFLIWLASRFGHRSLGGYWTIMGLIAGAGLVMAISQLLGGWTKFGRPHLSAPVFLTAFVPIAVVSLWVIVGGQPAGGWLHHDVLRWSNDIHVRGVVNSLLRYIPVLAFGTGLALGYCFDTARAPRREVVETPARTPVAQHPVDRRAADEPLTADRTHEGDLVGARTAGERRVEIREGGNPVAPQPATTDEGDAA